MNITHFLEWFVPGKVRHDPRLVGRYRGITGSLLSITIITTTLALVYGVWRPVLTMGEWAVMLGGIVFPFVGALYIRQTGNITQGLIVTNLAGIAVVVGWAVLTGGIVSVALPWMIANLALICTFGNMVIQAAIGAAAIVALAVLFVLTRYDMLPPSIIDAAMLPQMSALTLISCAALMLGAALVIADERARAKARLRGALERVEVANRTKSTFLSSMSHEFRTPLAAVLGYAEVLREDRQQPLSAVQRQQLDHIIQAAEHLSALVNQVLDMARLEAGDIEIHPAPVDVFDMLHSACAMMSLDAQSNGVTLSRDLPDEPLRVTADPTRLRQVLINLLSNAIRFNRPNGSVVLRARALEGRVRIEVRDTGPGIAADRQAELFTAFSRLGVEATRLKGSGLGLAIAHRLVGLMGGTIGCISEEGKGATFWFELPG